MDRKTFNEMGWTKPHWFRISHSTSITAAEVK